MIVSCCKKTEVVRAGGCPRSMSQALCRAAYRKLAQLQAAVTLDELAGIAGNNLEKLRGNYAGSYSIRINDQWRLVFRWEADGFHDVCIVDYH